MFQGFKLAGIFRFGVARHRCAVLLISSGNHVHRIPCPTFRDDREAPLLSGPGRREAVEMICPTGRAKYFCAKGWTPHAKHAQ